MRVIIKVLILYNVTTCMRFFVFLFFGFYFVKTLYFELQQLGHNFQQHPGSLHKYIPCFPKNALFYLLFFFQFDNFGPFKLSYLEILQGKCFHPYKSFIKNVCFFWGNIYKWCFFSTSVWHIASQVHPSNGSLCKVFSVVKLPCLFFFPVTCTAFPGEIQKEGQKGGRAEGST